MNAAEVLPSEPRLTGTPTALVAPQSGAPLSDIESELTVLPGPRLEFSGTIVAGAILTGTIVANDLVLDGTITLTDGTRTIRMTGGTIDVFGGVARFSDAASIGDERTELDKRGLRARDPAGGSADTIFHHGGITHIESISAPKFVIKTTNLELDGSTANNSRVAGVVISTSPPSGDYPTGTFWAET